MKSDQGFGNNVNIKCYLIFFPDLLYCLNGEAVLSKAVLGARLCIV